MKNLLNWIKLIRSGNLIIMLLIVWLVNQLLVAPFLEAAGIPDNINPVSFILLCLSIVASAAAGNIINDLVDEETDRINRPHKLIINKTISEKKARVAYVLLVSIAAFSALLLSIQLKSIYFFLITVVFNGLLWFYAKRYKQQFLVGNLVVAFLSAGLVLYVWLYDLLALIQDPIANSRLEPVMSMMIQVVMTYTGFAFLASLIREIIKDMQDLKGDFETGCRTMPVVIGISATTKLVWGLMALLLALIIWWQFLLFSSTALAAFGFLFVTDSLLLICAMQLSNQSDPQRFKRSSSLMKIVMLTGIFSIVFIHL